MAEGEYVPRTAAAFRVGITGARALPNDEKTLTRLREQLDSVLGQVKTQVETLAASPVAAGIYLAGAPQLRLLSPLAEGADRLAAEAALALGYLLEVPMPFAQADYEADFPKTLASFRQILARAGDAMLELDGGRNTPEEENRSYEAAGRFVVRNCDLLIAIWDGGPGNGQGGTADIVQFAARHSQPVWWLRADAGGAPCWIESTQDLRRPGQGAKSDAAARLATHIRNLILPPMDEIGTSVAPLRAFLAASPQLDFVLWQVHAVMMRLAGGKRQASPALAPAAAPAGTVWQYWDQFYKPADRLAIDYANRYRSSYVMILILAALALTAAAFVSGFGEQALLANIGELTCLVLIAVLVIFNLRRQCHERFITCRLFAELCRKQQSLALFGWTLPPAEASHISGDVEEIAGNPPRDLWVGWFFNAAVRAGPLPHGRLAGAGLQVAVRAVEGSLVAGQAGYHGWRREASERAAKNFGGFGRFFFWATLVLVVFKLVLLCQVRWHAPLPPDSDMRVQASTYLRLLLGFLPGVSAAFVGIRGYTELELLVNQSAQMQRTLLRTEAHLRALDMTAPLASQDVAAEILALAQAMLLDVKGWAQLFRVKAVEAN